MGRHRDSADAAVRSGAGKEGLKPREEFGPVLEAGKSYRLVIDKGLRDANNSARPRISRSDLGGPMIEAAVDCKQWKIESPPISKWQAACRRVSRPLDQALLMRMITTSGFSR